MCSPFLSMFVLSFFFFLFFSAIVRLQIDTAQLVCTWKITIIACELYIDDDVAG